MENQGSSWNFAVDYLERFLAEQLAENPLLAESPHGYSLALMELLSRRTAELRLAFARSTGDAAFDPESINRA